MINYTTQTPEQRIEELENLLEKILDSFEEPIHGEYELVTADDRVVLVNDFLAQLLDEIAVTLYNDIEDEEFID